MMNRTSLAASALVLAFAFAVLSGVFLPAVSPVHAVPPVFDTTPDPGTRLVLENTPPGVNIGAPISATDSDETEMEFGQTLTYRLRASADTDLARADAASFDIDSSTGQLITKAPLNFETKPSYTVSVTVDDGEDRDEPIAVEVTISVTDEDIEAPAAPARPTVVSGPDTAGTDADESTTSLRVIWHTPENTGDDITAYSYQYKKEADSEDRWSATVVGDTTTSATITGLDPNTSYQVRVRATNGEGTSPWSLMGTGATNRANNRPPTIDDEDDDATAVATIDRSIPENEAAGQDVGREVSAEDPESTRALSYRLDGPHADLFDLNTSNGQIRTKRGVTYNHEDPGCGYDATDSTTECTYRVTVVVFDGAGGSDARAVDIAVTDIREAPSRPKAPVVRATEKNSRSLEISWQEPANTGSPITGYDIRYRKVGGGIYTTRSVELGTSYTLAPADDEDTADTDERLEPNERYQVVVRAKNDERDSLWSPEVTARTNRGNDDPAFDDRDDFTRAPDGTLPAFTTDRSVKEDARPGQAIGKAIRAIDGNNDRRTYELVPTDSTDEDAVAAANKFEINESTGQLLTKAPLNHEDADCDYVSTAVPTSCIWTVMVEVTDGLDEHRNAEESPTTDDTITVRIAVEDVNEPPLAPTVTVSSSSVADGAGDGDATLTVTWDMPKNSDIKPPVTAYVVECTGPGITTDRPCPQPTSPDTAAATNTYDIGDLNPAREYRVRVRAKNDEGEGAWSAWVVQRTSRPGNVIPRFITDLTTATFTVAENARAGSLVGAPIEASDDEDNTVTYKLDGPDADVFNIGSRGQIVTRSTLSHEDPRCYDETDPESTKCTYTVRVKISDRQGGAVTSADATSEAVSISVTDEPEPPDAPGAPRVTPTKDSGQKLEVAWNAPRNTGPPITDYDVRYRKAGETDWEEWPHGTDVVGSTATKTTISRIAPADDADPLEPRTRYEVEVRAKNTEGESSWSRVGQGTTGASNSRPTFENEDSPLMLEVDENTRGGQNIGSPVSATDADRNRLTYRLEGPAADSFSIVSSSGQIRTKAALDYEERRFYSLTVVADDGQRKGNSTAAKSVTITVRDKREPPSPPSPPKVSGVRGSTDSVRVTWGEPRNTGEPITHYNVRYGESGSGGLGNTIRVQGVMDRSIVITGLAPGTRYEVQVRPESPEGHPDWSRSGFGAPNPDVANQSPRFSSSGVRTFNVEENSVSAGDAVGDPVTAVDPDLDPVTHTLEGTDATSFTIDSGSGQIRTTRELNHEERSRYSVTVKATDTRGGSVTVGVTITVTDVDEPPDTPFAPAVTAVSSASLQASWQEPANTGPSITDYDYRYRSATDSSWTEVTNTTIAGTTVTIQRLTASTSYEVQVRARNDEGASDWSPSGISATNAPGANNPPVFSDGASAARSVSATASAGANIGAPVTATDADPGDTLTYGLEGRDAASFAINTANGQLLTKIGVTLLVGETYTVEVSATDGTDVARITVSIEVTAAPPNNPPVFSEGASANRSVRGSAQAGTAIGRPVTATDSDPGSTLTYSLEGANSASFNINPSTGQLLTRAGVTLPAASFPVTVVARDQLGGSGRITVTITIVPNAAPIFASTSTTRSVNENVAGGTAVGGPVTATDADNDTLTYTLGGADAARFAINSRTGQITVGSGTMLDYETRTRYSVVVTAADPDGARDTITVSISVTNVDEVDPGRFDANNDGSISRDEVFRAIQQFLTGQATSDDVLGVILRFISGQ